LENKKVKTRFYLKNVL